MTIPEDFREFPTSSPFVTSVGPFYGAITDDAIVLGLVVEQRHCNTAGYLHGTMFSALADIALGNNIGRVINQGKEAQGKETQARIGITTVNLSIDFAGNAREGDWVEMHTEVQKVGSTLAYANGYLKNGDEPIGRASGVYRLLERG